MIYLIDQGFRIKSALDLLVNQVKCSDGYKMCQCLSCKVKSNVEVNQGTCFADVYDINDKDNDNVNDNVNDKDIYNNNVIDNDLQSSFTDDNFMYLFDEKHQKGKPNNTHTNDIYDISSREPASQTKINDDLKSWLNDDDIITEAAFPDNFRCILSCPSECGKTFLFKKLFLFSIYFDKLYIIGPTSNQYEGVEGINRKADVEFIKDMKDLPSPDKLPKDLKKLMIFDDVRAREPVISEYFCRGRHNNCNMIYLNQNLFTIDRRSVRENCNLFILFEQRFKVLISIYQNFFNNVEISYKDFANICNKV